MQTHKILLADDDSSIRTVLQTALTRAGFDVRSTGNAANLWKWVNEGEGDLIVTDVVMPDENAFDLIPRIKKLRPQMPVIVMSAQNTMHTAIRAAEQGAFEYLPKPFDLNELVNAAKRALRSEQRDDGERAGLGPTPSGEQLPLIGRSPAMQEVYRILARLMNTDLTVMITGESGTGKELAAKALHDLGKRRNGPFVAVNMAAIPRDLIESELFGHEKGAFTGANTRGVGRFEQAEGGTLFLDEIGDMPLEAQTRLLRVLQEGEYVTVGGRNANKTNVRIVAASNKDLKALIETGQFREDLFFRLNVVPLRLPPLRERKQDIPELARYFLAEAVEEGLSSKTITQGAIDALTRYDWPGNVRELKNVIQRSVAIYSDETIEETHVARELDDTDETSGMGVNSAMTLSDAVQLHINNYFDQYDDQLPPPGLYEQFLPDFERPLIKRCINATGGNQIRAAELLGLNRNTLRKKLRDLGIEVVRGTK